jgi:hypothetical protein
MPELNSEDGDDRLFLGIVERIVDAVSDDVRDLCIIRVDNWFDHKWLRFSGKGRVPFQDPRPSHPGVALDEFSQDKLTFPPFSPRRIVGQDFWTFADSERTSRLIHSHLRQHSAANLHRRVADFSDSMVAIWFSSRTEDNRQGSVMQYTSQSGSLAAWYMSVRLESSIWRLVRTKGIARERAEAFVVDDDPPLSVVTEKR